MYKRAEDSSSGGPRAKASSGASREAAAKEAKAAQSSGPDRPQSARCDRSEKPAVAMGHSSLSSAHRGSLTPSPSPPGGRGAAVERPTSKEALASRRKEPLAARTRTKELLQSCQSASSADAFGDVASGSSPRAATTAPPPLQPQSPQPPCSPQRRKAQEERLSASTRDASQELSGPGPPPGLEPPRLVSFWAANESLTSADSEMRAGFKVPERLIVAEAAPSPPPGLGSPDLARTYQRRELLKASPQYGAETDSYDEEVELLRCEADLVAAAADLGTTTSADDDDFLTTDADLDDGEDSLMNFLALPLSRTSEPRRWHRSSVSSVVIEEDEEDMSSGNDGGGCGFEADSASEIRSRLWAQSLLRMRRSIDEIYMLCEFESDECLCEQVSSILETASKDFNSLLHQLESQQEYALLGAQYPFKTAVAWTTRTPSTAGGTESLREQLEKVQLNSPSSHSTSGRTGISKEQLQRPSGGQRRRPSSTEPRSRAAGTEDAQQAEEPPADASGGGGTGEAMASTMGSAAASSLDSEDRREGSELPCESACEASGEPGDRQHPSTGSRESRSSHLYFMVQSALEKVHARLAQSRPSPEELQERHEARQRRAQQVRAFQDDQRILQSRQAENRISAARERRQEREQRRQRELLEKMTRARRQYQEQLRIICQRARKENRKIAEVAYVARESLNSEREILKQKQENAHSSRKVMRETMRQKLIESANRVAKVSENRKRLLEVRQEKLQQELEEKERLASQRRMESLNSIRLKNQGQETRSEMVRVKRQQLQEVDERSSQDFLRFRSKNIGRLALDCDGLPEGVREEVAEQQPSSARRSSMAMSAKSQRKDRLCRPSTPPPTVSTSPKSTPPRRGAGSPVAVAAAELGDGTENEEALPPPWPLTEIPRLPGSGPDAFPEADSPSKSNALGADRQDFPRRKGGSSSSGGKLLAQKAEKPTSRQQAAGAEAKGAPKGGAGDGPAADGPTTATVLGVDASSTLESADAIQESGSGVSAAEMGMEAALRSSEALRSQLMASALTDEEALRIASETEGIKAVAANAAQRARISKLAADLGKIVGFVGTPGASTEDLQQPANSLNLERTEAVLGDFCKILSQSQREADCHLILKLHCARMVVDICVRVKDSIAGLSVASAPASAWKLNSNVMLCALKFLGLLCKQRLARVFLLLTSRVLVLADVATACLDMHFADALKPQDAQGGPVLFLPQLLHVLSLHTKQSLPEGTGDKQGTLAGYLLLCGLAEKLRELFRRSEIRGLKFFDGASPVPLLLLRAMGFLGTLVSAYRLPAGPSAEALEAHARVLEMFRQTELFGIVGILVSILLSEGRREKGARLPQTVISLAVQALRILNSVARIDLSTLQETLSSGRQQELYHLLVGLLDYCVSRVPAIKPGQSPASQGQAEENDLLQETVVLLGFYCVQQPQNQSIMCYGEGQSLLARLTSLPLHYFMDERGRAILFPTILATCYKSEQNLEILRSEMNLSLLRSFLAGHIAQREEAKQPESVSPAFAGRFPAALWQEALAFLDSDWSGAIADSDHESEISLRQESPAASEQ